MRGIAAAVMAVLWLAVSVSPSAAGWTHGEFQSGGKPVEENHCVPSGAGPFPAVVIIHGSGPRDLIIDDFEDLCTKLADHGYYAEYIEYYSQTDAVAPNDLDAMIRNFPTWLNEVQAGIVTLKKNPAIAPKKVGLMGFSLGGFIALTYGVSYPDDVAAIVEYYGGLSPALYPRVSSMPPVLILHGASDRIVPVSQARDLDAALTKAGRPHEMKIYPDAQHVFNFPDAMGWYKSDAAHDAWDRSLKFLDTYLKGNRN
jgi:carboxymethylenebutenolidase